jgi:hypothetical protein
MKKFVYLLILLSFFSYAKAGDNKTVSLITSGQGKTKDAAKYNALRNAIEQAFGAFISSHTEVVNDNLVKDEIISVSNGNIQKYEIISESALPDNLGYTTTLKTIVSISKLTSFCESKGMNIEIKGSLFAFNVIQKELSASNEKKALQELVLMAENIAPKMFDYILSTNDPISNNNGSYTLPLKVTIKVNNNWGILHNTISEVLNSLSIKDSELDDLKKLNIITYQKSFLTPKGKIRGKYKYYREFMQPGGDEKEFDLQEMGLLSPNRRWECSICPNKGKAMGRVMVNSEEFTQNNYTESNLTFRTNEIEYILKRIQTILESEVKNYSINSDKSIIANGSNSKTWLYTPIEVYRSSGDWNDSRVKIEYRFYLWGVPFNKAHKLTNNTVFFNDFKNGAIVGFAYPKISLGLDQIKSLNKIEIKYNQK